MISRKIQWLSSLNEENHQAIDEVGVRLMEFYRLNENYYENIDGSSLNWVNTDEVGYQEILEQVRVSGNCCEVGCGSANLLKHYPELQSRYWGCDFSNLLLQNNAEKFPRANFHVIEKLNCFPFQDESFDLVFSIFVIEHSNRPDLFLKECSRIVKSGGRLIILCPDFLGFGRMPSQRSGFSSGTTSDKLKRGTYYDALITFFDNRVRIPLHSFFKRKRALNTPQFLININPTVFEDPFIADVDAVYVTCKEEMVKYLGTHFEFENNSAKVLKYERDKRVIFMSMKKVK